MALINDVFPVPRAGKNTTSDGQASMRTSRSGYFTGVTGQENFKTAQILAVLGEWSTAWHPDTRHHKLRSTVAIKAECRVIMAQRFIFLVGSQGVFE
jgi:hypothetical protein